MSDLVKSVDQSLHCLYVLNKQKIQRFSVVCPPPSLPRPLQDLFFFFFFFFFVSETSTVSVSVVVVCVCVCVGGGGGKGKQIDVSLDITIPQ